MAAGTRAAVGKRQIVIDVCDAGLHIRDKHVASPSHGCDVEGQSAGLTPYIATVARRGYKFIADVQTSIADVDDDLALAEPLPLSRPPLLRGIVGREADMADIADLLIQKRHVTLAGAGGVGKTTVAIAVGRAFAPQCRDGMCFVDLATISDPTLFGAALVTALGVRGNPDNSLAAVLDYLRPRQMLLILDNCEHVLPAATIFAGRFMADTSSSKLLATSREPLAPPPNMSCGWVRFPHRGPATP